MNEWMSEMVLMLAEHRNRALMIKLLVYSVGEGINQTLLSPFKQKTLRENSFKQVTHIIKIPRTLLVNNLCFHCCKFFFAMIYFALYVATSTYVISSFIGFYNVPG